MARAKREIERGCAPTLKKLYSIAPQSWSIIIIIYYYFSARVTKMISRDLKWLRQIVTVWVG